MVTILGRIVPILFLSLVFCANALSSAVEEVDLYQPDKIARFVHRAHALRIVDWPEHKNGKIVIRTNNLGFREDNDTKIEKENGVVRVLVTGDSHIDGVVNNNESFPYLLGKVLNSRSKIPHFEVINGGVGHYQFDDYLLFLKKYLFIKPDMYIVVVYTGNDFLDAAKVLEQQGMTNERPPPYFSNLNRCNSNLGVMAEALNQLYYFKNFPLMKDKTVEHALEVIAKINELCLSQNISFLVILLPTKVDVEWKKDEVRLNEICNCLGLTNSDLRTNQDLKDRLIAVLSKNKISTLDLYPVMSSQPKELFWKRDYHLNDSGHKCIADYVYKEYNNFFDELYLRQSVPNKVSK